MTETSTTTATDANAATVPFALMALGYHMVENRLPLWTSLSVPGAGNRNATPRVLLLDCDLEPWLASLDVTTVETIARRTPRYPFERIHHAALPTGFRVDIVELLADAPLQVVQS